MALSAGDANKMEKEYQEFKKAREDKAVELAESMEWDLRYIVYTYLHRAYGCNMIEADWKTDRLTREEWKKQSS